MIHEPPFLDILGLRHQTLGVQGDQYDNTLGEVYYQRGYILILYSKSQNLLPRSGILKGGYIVAKQDIYYARLYGRRDSGELAVKLSPRHAPLIKGYKSWLKGGEISSNIPIYDHEYNIDKPSTRG